VVWRLGAVILQVRWQAVFPESVWLAASVSNGPCGYASMPYSQFALYGLITWFGGLELSSCS
jgi:hypothetical protein